MNELFSAVSLSDLANNVGGILIAFITVALMFVGIRYIRKAGVNDNISGQLSYLYEDTGSNRSASRKSNSGDGMSASEFNRSQKTYEPWDDGVFEAEVSQDMDDLSPEEFNEKYPSS